MSYRWVALAVSVLAQASSGAVLLGPAAITPALRQEYGLDLTEIGLAMGAVSLGMITTLLLWGIVADRIGERPVVVLGLAAATLTLTATALTQHLTGLLIGLACSGMGAASANAATGRVVVGWFQPRQRGMALGIRQTALPLGGAASAAALPMLCQRYGAASAFLALAAGCAVASLCAALWLRTVSGEDENVTGSADTSFLCDGRVWRLACAAALLVVVQFGLMSVLVTFLDGHADFTPVAAAAVLSGLQLAGIVGRVASGWASDRLGSRTGPLRVMSLAIAGLLVSVSFSLLRGLPAVPVLLVATLLALSWNSLTFTAAAEMVSANRSGAAFGLLNSVQALAGAFAPGALALLVVETSWPFGFAALAGCAAAATLVLRGITV